MEHCSCTKDFIESGTETESKSLRYGKKGEMYVAL